jgi:transcriptional regulatory protein RtcR
MHIVTLLGRKKDRFTDEDTGIFSPTVALALHSDLLDAKSLRILYTQDQHAQAKTTAHTINAIMPALRVELDLLADHDAFDPVSASTALMDVVSQWDQEAEYGFSLGTGTHVHMHLWFKLVECGYVNGTLLQIVNTSKSPLPPGMMGAQTFFAGRVNTLDLRLSRYEDVERRMLWRSDNEMQFLKNGIATLNESYNAMIEMIEKVGVNSQYPLLLTGPSGAGKTALAKRVYQLRHERHLVKGEWVAVNCATLSESHAMSVLFGHKKGAFTGADTSRSGLLAKANQGVLFLDEVACLPAQVQSMLLHALDTGEYYPMGSDRPVTSSFMLLCGTNEDLPTAVEEGRFRDDLLARLDTWHFQLPGLASRKEDIAPNLDFELRRFREESGAKVRFSPSARAAFLKFATSSDATWLRNFRDLRNAVVRMGTLSESGVITEQVVEQEVIRLSRQWGGACAEASVVIPSRLKEELMHLDYKMLEEVVRVCQASLRLTDAAKTLYQKGGGDCDIQNPASRLKNYLSRFGVDFEEVRAWSIG